MSNKRLAYIFVNFYLFVAC